MMTMMVLLLAVTVATAQRGQRQGSHGLPSELKLTTEQQEQIKAIKQEGRAQMQEIRKQNPDQRPDREAMKKMREASQEKLDAILTPEQRKQLAAIKTERKTAWKAVDKKAIKADLKQHTETKVKPVIAAARAQFNQFLSTEDQAALDRLRPIFSAKPKGKASHGKGKAKGDKPSEADITAKKEAMKAWKADHASDIAELKALTKKYAVDLERIQERMKPQQEQWSKEKREIMSSHLPEGAKRGKGKSPRARKGKAENGKRKGHRQGKGKKTEGGDWPRGAAFLLMKG